MHQSVLDWCQSMADTYDLADKSVLDVGSLDVNGSPRSIFTGKYHGLDMQGGPGVDEVGNAHNLILHTGSWDVIVCTEMLEHDSLPWISLQEMRSAVKEGGYLILTTRGYDERGCFPVHGYPEDHWRYSVSGLTHLLVWSCWKPIEVVPDPEAPGVLSIARAV